MRLYETALAKFQQKIQQFGEKKMEKQKAILQIEILKVRSV